MQYDHHDFEVAEDAPFDADNDHLFDGSPFDVVEAMERDEATRLEEGFSMIDQEG